MSWDELKWSGGDEFWAERHIKGKKTESCRVRLAFLRIVFNVTLNACLPTVIAYIILYQTKFTPNYAFLPCLCHALLTN